MRTKFAVLVGKIEGCGIPGAIPTVRNNPGDLRHSPHSQHPGGPAHANDVGTIDTIEHGWEDLERQLRIFADWGYTIQQALNVYLGVPKDADINVPDVDGNHRVRYIKFVCDGLGVPPTTTVAEALKIAA